jgi:alpha-L-fucosidase
MGSLEPWQSREMYDLVKSLQPDCMVSGRLGNDVYDFAVMADNKLPQTALHAPWQSAASMFPETWGYRSWQERGRVEDKVAEKLRSLIKVVAHGGNYLLNIGPASDGSVVPFEAEVIRSIGSWLSENGDAIYGAQPSPFDEEFEWGDVTVKGDNMYLHLTGKYPEEGYIELNCGKVGCRVEVDRKMYADPTDVHVIKVELSNATRKVAAIAADKTLSWKNATPDYSYSCFDYYSNYRSTVAYNWLVVNKKPIKGVRLKYAMSDACKAVRIQVGDKEYEEALSLDAPLELKGNVTVVSKQYGRMRGGTFDRATNLDGVKWEDVTEEKYQARITPFSNHLMKVVLNAQKPCRVHLGMITGNGMELLIRDNATGEYVSMMKHLNPYRAEAFAESVVLDLEKGDNEIVLRSYNRFEDSLLMYLRPHHEQLEYEQILMFDEPVDVSQGLPVRISSADNQSEHTDCKLHNLQLELIY